MTWNSHFEPITRAIAEQRILEKLTGSLTDDIAPLLPMGVHFNGKEAIEAFESVGTSLITRLQGDAGKLTDEAVKELRKNHLVLLLR